MQHSITPNPTAEEATAIAAAIEVLWPKAGLAVDREPSDNAWRFSGRWWNDSAVTRRTRPGF
jgi:hypothetical protein